MNNKNEIIVTDFHNHSVKVTRLSGFRETPSLLPLIRCDVPPQVYNADGEFLFKFGSHGEGNGQFNAPTGVAVDSNGNIIVADWGNSRIQAGRRLRPHYSTDLTTSSLENGRIRAFQIRHRHICATCWSQL